MPSCASHAKSSCCSSSRKRSSSSRSGSGIADSGSCSGLRSGSGSLVCLRSRQVCHSGFGSIGGIVSAAGDTNVNIGVLRTGGDEAAGLDLSAGPTACVVLGAGSCDTAFTVGELTTAGDRSPGAIVRGAGDITADVGVLRTSGDEAAGLDLASDPTACAILGAGGCDTSFSVGELTTRGDGATGVLVRSTGDTTGSIGVLSTQGDDAAGVDIASDPTACVIAGVGACDVALDADSVSTSGDGAAGVLIDTSGATTGDFGTILTRGDGSTGLGINQDPTACLALGPGVCRVTAAADRTETDGDNSNAIDIASPGPISLDAGIVDTAGDLSDGIRIAGADGAVSVIADSVNTVGADSDGIDVFSTTGAQTIDAGRVSVAGVGADAIVAAAVCANIGITARDDVISAQGSAIVADTGCAVSVSTLPGAAVSGATAGIDIRSGTGATVTIGDTLAATAGPALNIDGAAAFVTIAPTGLISGVINLTDAADQVINNGAFNPVGDSDFGAGADVLVNNGRIEVDGSATLAGLEQLTSSGVIDLSDGAVGDSLTVGGAFTGANGQLLVDYGPTGVDQLIIGGAAGGSTAIVVSPSGPLLVDAYGSVVVDAGSIAPGAFTLGGETSFGLVDVTLRSNVAGDVVLFAAPNEFAIQPVVAGGLVTDFWYQSADAWSAAAAARRDRAGGDGGLWLQGYGGSDSRDVSRAVDVFGTPTEADFGYDTTRYGAQGGFDFISGMTVFGVTAGFGRAESDLALDTNAVVDGFNIGAYLVTETARGFYFEGLAKADFYDVDFRNDVVFDDAGMDGVSYGAEGEAGYRMRVGRGYVDLGAGLAYVRSELEGFDQPQGSYAFEDAESLRGRIGARYVHQGDRLTAYGDIKLLHEFMGNNGASFTSGGFALPLEDESKGTWVRAEAGVSSVPAGSAGYFVAVWADLGGVQGIGLRAGIRF